MMALWPFAQWELDILGHFPTGIKQMKFLMVRIDYFTKWVEAVLFINLTVLFQLLFSFIYNIFNKKLSILVK